MVKNKVIEEADYSKNIPNFWEELEKKDSDILKFNPEGKYDKKFPKEYRNFLDLLHNLPIAQEYYVGDIVTGKLVKMTEKYLEININFKDSVYVNLNAKNLNLTKNLTIGDEIKVMIISIKENPYEIIGSISELYLIDAIKTLKKYYEENTPFLAKVKEIIPAGFMLDININNITINAFMPNTLAGVNKLTTEQTNDLLGKEIYVMLESLQKEKDVYIVSRRKYLKSLIPEEIKKLKKETVYTGVVTGSKKFGVFIEFNTCLTGLIYKFNLNPDYQDKIEEIKPGTLIDFYVKDILSNNRIILSQNLNKSLWESLKKGQKYEGVINDIKSFGILINLDPETIGLIPNKQLTKINNNNYKKGDKINVIIDVLIPEERRIYLKFAK